MKQSKKIWLLWILTALLTLLWPKSGFSAAAPEVVLKRVPPGWTAESEGYYLNAEALSSLTAAARTYRQERDAWERAYYELSDMAGAFQRDIETQIAGLREQLAEERAAWARSLRRARSPGLGVFAGVGYGPGGVTEPVVGVGIVWRLF